MSAFDLFDGICVINLDKDIDRWVRFRKEAEIMGIEKIVHRIPAVYHEVGSYGCALSHKKAVEYARERGWDNVLILEDDIKFLHDKEKTCAVLTQALQKMPDNWSILYLGINIKPGQEPIEPGNNPFTSRVLYYWGEFAMAIHSNTYAFIIDHVPDNVDEFTGNLRGDMVNMKLDAGTKFITNPCLVAVYPFNTQTGVGVQLRSSSSAKAYDRDIVKEYVRHKLYCDPVQESITILIKTFKRPRSLGRLIRSIRVNYGEVKIIIADDSDEQKATSPLKKEYSDRNTDYWVLPFDTGVSYGRNFLLSKATTEYVVLCDDDFIFTEKTDLRTMLDTINNSRADIVGGSVTGKSACSYAFRLTRMAGALHYLNIPNYIDKSGLVFTDIIPNFFIANTDVIRSVKWCSELKTVEHSEFFFRCMSAGVKTAHSDAFSIDHDHSYDNSAMYRNFRGRGSFIKEAAARIGVVKFMNKGIAVPQPQVRKFSDPVYLENGLNSLSELAGILNRYNIRYWAANGTLLGIHRDDSLISHDTDIDLQVSHGEITYNLVMDILVRGFKLIHMFGTYENGFELSFTKYGVKIDLFSSYDIPGNKVKFSLWRKGRKADYTYSKFKLVKKLWKGITVYVPDNIEKVLEEEYGVGWNRTDNGKRWDYMWSRSNLVIPEEFNGDKEAYRQDFESKPSVVSTRVTDVSKILVELMRLTP